MLQKLAKSASTTLEKYTWIKYLLIPLALIPFFLAVIVVLRFAVNVLYMDEWELVRLFRHYYDGSISLGDFWTQHNEHRIFFISITTLYLGLATHWNLVYQTIVSLLLALAMFGVFARYITKIRGKLLVKFVYIFIVCGLIFSLTQWENWLQGFQMQWFFCLAPGVASVYLLDARAAIFTPNWRFFLAIFLNVVSTYSLGSGVFFWLAGYLQIIATKQAKKKHIIWIIAAILCFAFYFYNYKFLEGIPGTNRKLYYVQFFFAYLGNVFSYNPEIAVTTGSILVLLTGLLVGYAFSRRIAFKQVSFPIGIILFVILSDLITMHSRVGGGGPMNALTSRYSTIATLLPVALILMYAQVTKARKLLPACVVAIVVLPLVLSISLYGLGKMRQTHSLMVYIQTCMHQPAPSDECLGKAHPAISRTRDDVVFLKKHHLASF